MPVWVRCGAAGSKSSLSPAVTWDVLRPPPPVVPFTCFPRATLTPCSFLRAGHFRSSDWESVALARAPDTVISVCTAPRWLTAVWTCRFSQGPEREESRAKASGSSKIVCGTKRNRHSHVSVLSPRPILGWFKAAYPVEWKVRDSGVGESQGRNRHGLGAARCKD